MEHAGAASDSRQLGPPPDLLKVQNSTLEQPKRPIGT